MMEKLKPINAKEPLYRIDELLITLLENLSTEEWSLPTIAPKWTVKDVALHLLDGNLRSLSMLRDNFYQEQKRPINSYQDLVVYLNELNADWLKATRRLSPKIIIELLRQSGKQYSDFINTLNLNEKAVFSVAWAGEASSKNWFHIAREYTEKWHHQQQIRLAIGQETELLEETWYLPYLDASIRGLPHHYRIISGKPGDLIKFTFRGSNDKSWFLLFERGQWKLGKKALSEPICEVIIQDSDAWRVFTKGITRDLAIGQSTIIGEQVLGEHIFSMLAVMA